MPRIKPLGVDRAPGQIPEKRKRGRPPKNPASVAPLMSDSVTPIDDESPMLTTVEAAAKTGVSVAWYKKARQNGHGPAYVKRGKLVRYPLKDLLTYWGAHRVASDLREGKKEAR